MEGDLCCPAAFGSCFSPCCLCVSSAVLLEFDSGLRPWDSGPLELGQNTEVGCW